MLRVRWLFQTEPPTDPRLLALKTTLNTLFEERFLLLVDAAYLYLIDQDLTRKRGPKWDADRKEVSELWLSHLIQQILFFISSPITTSRHFPTSSHLFLTFLSSLSSIVQ
jgi:hypothetical protein